ncbi:MAG: hypothetical protein H3Z53_05170 [archaeon]|nr:hypothetical protein [archaeon]MCP8313746.1 hypothetical protein [archaeon]MCP8315916.1 hypothetical protein [archaeon]
MARDENITQEELLKIRSELSKELGKMSPSQIEEYLEAAKEVYMGLSKMVKILETVKA